jgi:hypothetical protein
MSVTVVAGHGAAECARTPNRSGPIGRLDHTRPWDKLEPIALARLPPPEATLMRTRVTRHPR